MSAPRHAVRYERILVPVDFSPSTPRVLEVAGALALAYGAKLEVLHVLALNEADAAMAEAELPRCVPAALGPCVASRRTARAISAEIGIIHAAREGRADLVVMGTHGRSGLSHVLIGSVAERVVQLCSCPVLTVRRPEHVFRKP